LETKIPKEIEEFIRKKVLKLKNVNGYSKTLKPRIKSGKVINSEKCIRIYVEKKVPIAQLSLADIIPTEIMGYKTDVVEIGRIVSLQSDPKKRYRPLVAGISAMHYRGTACLAKGTKIFVNSDLISIENMSSQELVFSFDGKNIIKQESPILIPKGRKHVWILKLLTREIEATPDHEFLVLRKGDNPYFSYYSESLKSKLPATTLAKKFGIAPNTVRKWRLHLCLPRGKVRRELRWIPLKDLKKGDLVLVLKKRPFEGKSRKINLLLPNNQLKIPKETSKELMFLIGFILGDSIGKKLHICCSSSQETQQIQNLLLHLFGIKGWVYEENLIEVNSKGLLKFLKKLKISGNAHTKRIPEWVYTLPTEELKALVDGLITADGHKGKDGRWSIQLCNRRLLEDIRLICNLIGYRTSQIYGPIERKAVIEGRKVKGKIWGLSIYPNPKKGSRNWHKYEAELLGLDSEYLGFEPVKDIKKGVIKEVFDISLPAHHNFFANGILVHNCTLGLAFKDVETGEILLAQNNHCCSMENKASIGDPIIQPSGYDLGKLPDDKVGELFKFVPISFEEFSCPFRRFAMRFVRLFRRTEANKVDVGFFKPCVEWKQEVLDKGPVRGKCVPELNDKVWKVGRCFSKDTLILTSSGPKTASELKVGDEVYTYNIKNNQLELQPVKAVICQGLRHLFLVKTRNRSVKVTDNHPFLVLEKIVQKVPMAYKTKIRLITRGIRRVTWKPVWKPLKELKRGDIIVTLNCINSFKTSIGKEMARFLGFFLGDGSWQIETGKGGRVVLYCSAKNEAEYYASLISKIWKVKFRLVECVRCGYKFRSKAQKGITCNKCGCHKVRVMKEVGLEPKIYTRQNTWLVAYYSVDFAKYLSSLFPGKKLKKRIPELIWSLPLEERREFIRGYLDADGYNETWRNAWSFCSPNIDLIKQLRELCIVSGYRVSNLTVREKEAFKHQVVAEFRVWPHKSRERKFDYEEGFGHYPNIWDVRLPEGLTLEKIVKIESCGYEEAYDIEVANSQNFIGNGVLLHNTTGYTEGVVADLDWAGYVGYTRGTAFFEDCILVEGEGFSQGGDSSSPVFKGDLTVGMLFAGSSSHTIVCKIDNIEKEGKVKLILPESVSCFGVALTGGKDDNPVMVEIAGLRERVARLEQKSENMEGTLKTIKERLEKLSDRVWYVLSGVILSILIQILLRVLH
jgi:intein/homing endonuclease